MIALLQQRASSDFSIDDVAEQSGVNRTTLYRRWTNKQRLIGWAMLETMTDRLTYPDTGHVTDDFLEFAWRLNTFLSGPLAPSFARLMTIDAAADAELAAAVRAFWEKRLEGSFVLLDRAIERGQLPADIDRPLIMDCVFGPFYFRHLVHGEVPGPTYMRRIIERVLAPDFMRVGRSG